MNDFGLQESEPSDLWGVATAPLYTGDRLTVWITSEIRKRMVGLLDPLTNPDSWSGSDDDIYNTVNRAGELIAYLYGLVPMEFCIASETKPQGTQGGPSTSTTWHTRYINHVIGIGDWYREISPALILEPGRYLVYARAPGFSNGLARLRLNVDFGAYYLYGASHYFQSGSGVAQGGDAVLFQFIDTSVDVTLQLEHYIQVGFASFGLGLATYLGGIETYSQIVVLRVS